MPLHSQEIVNALESGTMGFEDVSEALLHTTIPVRGAAVFAMAKIAESDSTKRESAIERLKEFALTPGNRVIQSLGLVMSALAVAELLRLGDDSSRKAAAIVWDSLDEMERHCVGVYLKECRVGF